MLLAALALPGALLLPGSLFLAPDSRAETGDAPWTYRAATLEDGVFLRNWLICGPFPNPVEDGGLGVCLHDAGCTGFFTDYLAPIGGETGCAPQERLEVPGPDDSYRRWTGVQALGDRIYFDDYLSPAEYQTGYAVCWIDAEAAEDRLVSVGSNDGIRIWVNGQEVFRYHAGRHIRPDEHYLRLPLQSGRNQVLLKVDNCEGRWGFMMRPVSNEHAKKEVINRLNQVLRFDYRLNEAGFALTLGDPTVIGNIAELPEARITVFDLEDNAVARFEAPLCHPVALPFSDYPETEYRLEGAVLWPFRGRIVVPGMLYRGDLRAEVQALVSPGPPSTPESRPAEAIADLVSSIVRLDAHQAFGGEPRAYRRLKTGITQAIETSIAIGPDAPPYARLFPAPRQFGTSGHAQVDIGGNWTLQIAPGLFAEGLETSLAASWAELTGPLDAGPAAHVVRVIAITPGDAVPGGEALALPEDSASLLELVPEAAEGYAIRLDGGGAIIAGRTAAGAYYGLDTFLQLIGQAPISASNQRSLAGGTIIDAPLYETRAAVYTLDAFDDAFRDWVDHLARLRYNTLFLPSPLYPDLEDSEIQPMLVSAYAYCRARFIEPIPLVETFGADTLAARIDPNLLEGVYHEELAVEVDSLRRLNLPYDRLINAASTRPRLRTEKGYKILRLDRDYEIHSLSPPVIQLKGQAPVQTGEKILVSADLVDRSLAPTAAACPSDSETWLIAERVLGDIFEYLQPRGAHLGHTGAGYLNRDSRCLDRELPNDLILADAVQKGFDIVRKLDRKAAVYIWGDHFNPMQSALALDALKAPEYLPRDITVIDWHYRSNSYYDVWRVEQGIRYFDQFGFGTMGAARSNPLNVAQLAEMKPAHPRRFRGLVYRPESERDGGEYAVSQAGWEGRTMLGVLPD